MLQKIWMRWHLDRQRQAAKNERENWVMQHKDLESQVSEAHGLIDEQKSELDQLKAKVDQQEQNSNKKIEELQQANELLSSAKSEHDQASVHWKLNLSNYEMSWKQVRSSAMKLNQN